MAKKFKKEYIIGFGHPYVYRYGLHEGVMFYSDTDKRLSNTRDTYFPDDFHTSNRDVPEYELVLRRKRHGTAKRWAKEERGREEIREDRKAAKKRNPKARSKGR
jgi:hypothetical protein